VFHNIYVTDNKTTPGILFTQPAIGPYTTFTCAGFSHFEMLGNFIGDLESPPCGAAATKELKLGFRATSHGQQQYKQVTGTGPIFDTTWKLNGGAAETAAIEAEKFVVTLASASLVSCI
jgi:hypothetical protein